MIIVVAHENACRQKLLLKVVLLILPIHLRVAWLLLEKGLHVYDDGSCKFLWKHHCKSRQRLLRLRVVALKMGMILMTWASSQCPSQSKIALCPSRLPHWKFVCC